MLLGAGTGAWEHSAEVARTRACGALAVAASSFLCSSTVLGGKAPRGCAVLPTAVALAGTELGCVALPSPSEHLCTLVFQLMHKLSVEAPPKILVERYLIEIAKNYNVPYEPDSVVMVSEVPASPSLFQWLKRPLSTVQVFSAQGCGTAVSVVVPGFPDSSSIAQALLLPTAGGRQPQSVVLQPGFLPHAQ